MFANFGEQMKIAPPDIEKVLGKPHKNLEALCNQSAASGGEGQVEDSLAASVRCWRNAEDFSAMDQGMTGRFRPQEL